jgi:hypothetical protein
MEKGAHKEKHVFFRASLFVSFCSLFLPVSPARHDSAKETKRQKKQRATKRSSLAIHFSLYLCLSLPFSVCLSGPVVPCPISALHLWCVCVSAKPDTTPRGVHFEPPRVRRDGPEMFRSGRAQNVHVGGVSRNISGPSLLTRGGSKCTPLGVVSGLAETHTHQRCNAEIGQGTTGPERQTEKGRERHR